MRTPANPGKQLMTEIVTTLNQLFKKISKQPRAEFQLAEQYSSSSKKSEAAKKAATKSASKDQEEKENHKKYILKKAFKNYAEVLCKMPSFVQQTKDLDEKGKRKHMIKAWSRLSQEGKLLWCKNATTGKGKRDSKAKVKASKGSKTQGAK